MKIKTYYRSIAVIAVIALINFNIFGNLMRHFLDGFPINYAEFFINFLLFGVVIFFAWRQSIISALMLFFISLNGYYTLFSFGVTGFSIPTDIGWQGLFSVWLAMFTMVFCIIGGAYLFFKRFPKR